MARQTLDKRNMTAEERRALLGRDRRAMSQRTAKKILREAKKKKP